MAAWDREQKVELRHCPTARLSKGQWIAPSYCPRRIAHAAAEPHFDVREQIVELALETPELSLRELVTRFAA
jgi:hypothetical protein